MSDKITLELDRAEVDGLLRMLRGEQTKLKESLESVRKRIANLEAQISNGSGAVNPSQDAGAQSQERSPTRSGQRAPRGENLKKVRDYLFSDGPKKTNQIASAVGLPPSSVSSVIRNNPNTFFSTDGGWAVVLEP